MFLVGATGATSTSVPTVGGSLTGLTVLIVIAVVIILTGLVVILGRHVLEPKPPSDSGSSLVRSWIAISLVGGLLVFCAVALSLPDSSLRSTLFGGLITSVGASVAFYFSSKSADQAQQNVMNAALGTTDVPNLVGKTVTVARAELGSTPFQLVLTNPSAQPDDLVVKQSPSPSANVRNGTKVSIDTAAPPVVPPVVPGPT